ncbi:MAG: dTDP-4-dehydrorhamnose 3,5-epimerase [Solirubrobacteraceae bacterium]
MIFETTAISDVLAITPSPIEDERGLFARTFCAEEFERHGLDARVAQCNTSFNPRAGTLRGMHFQQAPHGEAKLVRCTRGAIFDVAVDLRPGSPTYRRWAGAELSQDNRCALFIPEGCAHGFQTLVDDTEVLYLMSTPYVPGAGRGVRWDDPAFGIEWPAPPAGTRIMSDRDASYPDFAT